MRREVPQVSRLVPASSTALSRKARQEHSHEQFLTTVRASLSSNNPAGIVDVVFGLLGDAGLW